MHDTPNHDFAALLRALDGRDALRPLVAALGFRRASKRMPAEPGHDARIVGERPGARAVLLEFEDSVDAVRVGRIARAVRARDLTIQHLFIAADRTWRRVLLACVGLEGELRHACIEPAAVTAADTETLSEMAAPPDEPGLAVALRHARALDRGRVTDRFFEDFRSLRARVATNWSGIPKDAAADRDELALLLLCRLMFLYFLQRAGRLDGDRAFLSNRFRSQRTGLYRNVLVPLFFESLNRRPGQRSPRALALGALPYLNGGLFERVDAERAHPRLDLADEVVASILGDLLERYRFAPRESGEDRMDGLAPVSVDPEMLGRVFERIMDPERRGRTGTFYTPSTLVDDIVADALSACLGARLGIDPEEARQRIDDPDPSAAAAARDLRVLDPACGSGAFLIGALARLARLAPDPDARRRIVGSGLHGVDVQSDAARLCSLRLWLALTLDVRGELPPLPNLDRRIRQGDALLDPLDLGAPADADSDVRRALRELPELSARYLVSEPASRPALERKLAAAERSLARAWAAAQSKRLRRTAAELRATAADRDLWGEPTDDALRARAGVDSTERAIDALQSLRRRMARHRELPFFSFRVHFAEAFEHGFDLILSNPPWIRAHDWPDPLRRIARARFAVCREAGWPEGARLAGAPAAAGAQVDLSQLFIEKSIQLLAPGGALGAVVPAKTFRSLYGAGVRALLLRETHIQAVHDYGLDQHAVFRADAFAGTVVACRPMRPEDSGRPVRIRMHARNSIPLNCDAPAHELPLVPGDTRSPWLIAPAAARRALRRMQRAGPPLGRHERLRVRRGVFTGANDVLLIDRAEPKLGGLATIRAAGRRKGAASSYEDVIESSTLRPVLRGAGISPWRFDAEGWVLWLHDARGAPVPPPPRTARYLERHADRLDRRTGARHDRPGAIFRVDASTVAPKVAWQDLARDLEAVAIPASIPDGLGGRSPVIPLNTVYFIPVERDDDALVLAAILNSLPVRTFARAIAERAKDACFRFFAWTVASIPLPPTWRTAQGLLEISRSAHRAGSIGDDARRTLDDLVAHLYGLTRADVAALAEFDAWLRGDA